MTWILLITAVIALAGSGLSMGIQPVDEGIDAWQSAVKSVVKDNDKKNVLHYGTTYFEILIIIMI